VSLPIAWSDLASDVRGERFNIDNAASIVAARHADPWAEYERSRQTVSASMRRTLHL
jgi:bifunctional non-homologous end joining protein LigD